MVITQPYNSRPRRLTHFGVESLGVERDRLWTEGDDFKKRLRRKQIILVSALNSAFGLWYVMLLVLFDVLVRCFGCS